MGNRTDLKDKQFGFLKVIEDTGLTKNESAVWKCECLLCGAIVNTTCSSLKTGTKSCGCLKLIKASQNGKKNIKDHAGETFDRLTVIGDSGKRTASHKILLACRCECDTVVNCLYNNLVSGRTRSCGCLKTESSHVDLTDRQFGRLTAKICVGTNKQRQAMWLCDCECGNTHKASSNSLLNRSTRSCGCLNKEKAAIQGKKMMQANIFELIDGTSVSVLRKMDVLFKNNTSGIRGVSINQKTGKWCASIRLQNKRYWLGTYEKIEDAAKVRKQAEEKLYGAFLEWYDEQKKKKGSQR